jgi:hypothetical protein
MGVVDQIFLRKKFGGLFLKNGSWVRVTIKGISRACLEF